MKIRVAQFGLGPIGQACVNVLMQKPAVELVGAIDIDPAKTGRDVGEVCGLKNPIGAIVRSDAQAALAEWRPQVVVHTTSSFLEKIEDQLAEIIRSGSHIVSSSEELFYPYERNPEFCNRIDSLAKQHNVAVVATGVNPGFTMDVLPLCLTGVCTNVKALKISRIADASNRRLPFQQKIGAGMTRAEFRKRLAAGGFGHIGLRESAQIVAKTLGWEIESYKGTLQPVLATKRVKTKYLTVEKGQVAGIHQTLRCKISGKDALVFDWMMFVGAKESYDGVEISGDPPISMRINGGVFGDTGTIGALVNTVPKVLNAAPGLRTMTDLPVPYAFL
ncbi:MAG: dihydrodipicolinate reductase [candidate division KSB1 bacterium]